MFPPQKIEIAFELRVDGVGICHAPAVWAGIFYKKGGFRAGTIYPVDERQRQIALDTIADVNASGFWPGKVVTEVETASDFREAEPEHQGYLERHPGGYTCDFPRADWVLPRRGTKAVE